MTFRVHALPLAPLLPLIDQDELALQAIGARRMVADAPNSAPCRVSLVDAEPGERLLLVNHVHLGAPMSPYRSRGPIFVREAAIQASIAPDCVPDMLARRLLSARVYDEDWMMIDADVIDGCDAAQRLATWLQSPAAVSIHLHTARRGCYLAAVRRL